MAMKARAAADAEPSRFMISLMSVVGKKDDDNKE